MRTPPRMEESASPYEGAAPSITSEQDFSLPL